MSEKSLKTDISNKEMFCYALTNTGQTMIYGIIGTFFMQYMTDVLAIGTAVVGVILLITRIWDAFNDPIMGVLVDRTKSKWGKCRPYMLFSPIPVALVCIMLFLPLKPGSIGTIIYVTAMYLVFDIVYTINDIPYWSMSAVITTNPDARVKVVSITRIIGGLGSASAVVLFMFIVDAIKGKTGLQSAYFISTIIFSVIGAALMLQGFFNTKERAHVETKPEPLFANLKLIFKAPPLLLNILAGMVFAITSIGTVALTTYFAKWNIWRLVVDGSDPFVNAISKIFNFTDPISVQKIFTPVLGMLPAVGTVLGLALTPLVAKRLDKRFLLIGAMLVGGVSNIIFFFVGYSNMLVFILGRFISCVPLGFWSGITTSMFGDSVDYLEYKTGKRTEGTCFSLLTLVGKFSGGVSALLIGVILAVFNYNVELGNKLDGLITDGEYELARAVQQPDSALKGIFLLTTLIMGIGMIITVIPFFFYKFSRAEHDRILEVIKERRAEAEAEAAKESGEIIESV